MKTATLNNSAPQLHVVFLVADAGVTHAPTHADDPIAQWLDLMEVVEALCPEWPEQDPISTGPFLL